MVAEHIIATTKPETNTPMKRMSLIMSATKYTATTTSAPVVMNSYMLPHGTRCAAIERVTTAAAWIAKDNHISAIATRASRRVGAFSS